jgi:hypothetical protein
MPNPASAEQRNHKRLTEIKEEKYKKYEIDK